jgi:sec-independent protein translocase protein TatB
MFGSVSFNEIMVILVIALIIFGPKRLPQIGRTVGKALGEFRRASSDLKRTMETEMSNIDKEVAATPSPAERIAPVAAVERRNEPVAAPPVAGAPVADAAVGDAPVVGEPTVEDSVVGDPVVGDPVVEEPVVEEPMVEEQTVEEPAAGDAPPPAEAAEPASEAEPVTPSDPAETP